MDDKATPLQKSAFYQKAKAQFLEGAKGLGDDVAVATGNRRPDMVVEVKPGKEDDEVVFVLPADEMRARVVPSEYATASLKDMVPWVERQALLTRLFRMADSGSPTLPGTVQTTLPAKVTTADRLTGDVTPPADALVLTMDRGEKFGVGPPLHAPRSRPRCRRLRHPARRRRRPRPVVQGLGSGCPRVARPRRREDRRPDPPPSPQGRGRSQGRRTRVRQGARRLRPRDDPLPARGAGRHKVGRGPLDQARSPRIL